MLQKLQSPQKDPKPSRWIWWCGIILSPFGVLYGLRNATARAALPSDMPNLELFIVYWDTFTVPFAITVGSLILFLVSAYILSK